MTPILSQTGLAGGHLVVLDGQATGHVFEGIGALSAGASSRLLIDYPEPQRSEILDFLFKPNFGAALQHLKVEIGGDVDSTDGTEPSIARTREEFLHPRPEYFQRGYEWWLMKEAKKRNPTIVLDVLQWGAPGWIGEGKFFSLDNADFIAAFINGAKQYHGLDISYCGIWNERPFDTEWIKLLRRTLDGHGLEQVKIVAAEEVNAWTILDAMSKDATLRDAVQVVGVHYPRGVAPDLAHSFGKPVWASEEGPWSGEWAGRGPHCAGLAQAMNRNYASGKMTKTIIWSPVTCYYDILPLPGSGLMRANTPWSGHYEVQPGVWITAHTTQFIAPGWKYLGGAASGLLPGGGSQVAAVSPDGQHFSVVIETMGATASQRLSFKLAGGLKASALRVWHSHAKEQFRQLADLPVTDGVFTIEVEPEAIYSLTTTSGQCKGATKIPPARPLALPYQDDFAGYRAGATPKYLSDFFGAFAVTDSPDGQRCLQQMTTRRGIEWVREFFPLTFVGDVSWRDYEVACDICLDFKKFAWLYGRCTEIQHTKGTPPLSYALRISVDGWWQLAVHQEGVDRETDTPGFCRDVLCAGQASLAAGAWHRFALRLLRDRVTVLVNGKEAGGVTDATYASGLAGIGCCYEPVKFRNLSVVEVRG